MRITRGLAATATAALGALLLTGCSTAEPEAAPPSPTAVQYPQEWKNCTVALDTVGDAENPNRARVTCGDIEREVSGDFSYDAINGYDPEETGGVRRISVEGDTASVWLVRNLGECLIVHEAEGEPVECEPTSDKARETPAPAPSTPTV